MRNPLIAILIAATLIFTNTCPCFGQTVQNPAAQTDKIKQQIEKFGIRKKITVIKLDGKELFGSILNIEADHFDLDEVNSRQLARVRFDEVKKIKKGLGNLNAFTGKRVNPPNRIVIGAIFVGAIIGLGVLVATQLK